MLAFHGIFTAYGFWLPNDPRGSWSKWVGAWELFLAGGPATTVVTTRSLAGRPHDRGRREQVKQRLKHRRVQFTGIQARAIGAGFAKATRISGYRVLACSILPSHVHVVVAAHRNRPAQVLGHLKREATLALVAEGLHPFHAEFERTGKLPSCWAERSWAVFLDTGERVCEAVRYVEENPLKDGKPRQRWSFVEPLDGWVPPRRDEPAG